MNADARISTAKYANHAKEELSRQDAKNAKFGTFEFGAFRFVSDFDIRISDLPSCGFRRASGLSLITYHLSLFPLAASPLALRHLPGLPAGFLTSNFKLDTWRLATYFSIINGGFRGPTTAPRGTRGNWWSLLEVSNGDDKDIGRL
jgi:hypothetical protein